MLARTPLYDFHVSAGARMVDFAGWEMPITYRSIIDEHQQTRNSGSLFDVSHMGRLFFTGADAQQFLEHAVTRNLATAQIGQCRYSLVCNEAGFVLDDIIVSKDENRWLVVCNASNREKLLSHFAALLREKPMDVKLDDQTISTAMIALQGPKVIERLSDALGEDFGLGTLGRYRFKSARIMFFDLMFFRSGYTGEDGVEIIMPAKAAGMAVKYFAAKGDHSTILPAGLGARDTLRLEAGMPLYGHELTEQIDPLSAALGWAVDLKKDFVGAAALRKIAEAGPNRKLVGLALDGRRIARQGTAIVHDGKTVGEVASGTFGPTVQKSIATAFVDAEFASLGTRLAADLKSAMAPATVVPLPFYKRPA
jgi:aminomethyltransferase